MARSFPGGFPAASTVTGSDKILIGQSDEAKECTVTELTAAVATAASNAATAAATAQADADAAMTEATAASAAASAAQADADAAATAAAAAQSDADAAATAAASAQADATSGSAAAASAASAASAAATAAASAATTASTAASAASAANTLATAANTLATAAKAQADSAADDATTALAAIATLETDVAALLAIAATVEKVLVGSTAGQTIATSTPTQIAGMIMPVVAGRRYWFTVRFLLDQNSNTAEFTMDASASLALIHFHHVTEATFAADGYDVAVVHGYCEANTSGVVRAKLATASGSLTVLGSPILTYRELSA